MANRGSRRGTMRAVLLVPGVARRERLRAVELELVGAPGVGGIDIDLVLETVTIDYDPDISDVAALTQAITEPRRAVPAERPSGT